MPITVFPCRYNTNPPRANSWYWALLFGFFFPLATYAQILEEDSIKADTRYGSIYYTTDRYYYTPQQPDTALTNFSRYSPVWNDREWAHTYLSNIGQAHHWTAFEYTRTVGFDMGWHAYDRYRLQPDSVRYYTSEFPFSEIKYALGTGEEQFLTAELGIPVRRNWHINALYRLMVGVGNYNRERVSWHNFALSTNYEHPKQRYRLLAFYLLNNAQNEQNGGIKTIDTNISPLDLVTESSIRPRTILDPMLTAADDAFKEHQFSLQQSYDGGVWYDLVKEDTTISKLFPTRRLAHRIGYQRVTRRYTDTEMPTDFYNQTYFSPTQTNDSMRWGVWQNEFFVGINGKRLADDRDKSNIAFVPTFQARAGFLHELISIDRLYLADTLLPDNIVLVRDTTQHLHSGSLQGWFQNPADSRLHLWASGKYALFGYNIADFTVSGGLQLRLSDRLGSIRGRTALQSITPALIAEQYVSNTAIWHNNFRKTQSLQFWASYINPKWRLSLTYTNHTFTNFIVWNKEQLPEQWSNAVNVSQFEVRHHWQLGKFHFDNALMLQLPSDTRLRMPHIVGRHVWYIEAGLFKRRATQLQLGIEISENTNYAADAYSPAIGQFYRQADALSLYPIIDAFVHVKVRRMRLFAKLRHANQGLFGQKGYYAAPQYPAYDRFMQFGLAWMFFD